MTARDDFDRLLTAWFDADAPRREPERLLGQVLARTARTRRRPAWLIPERWTLMSALSSTLAGVPRAPIRLVALAALLILAVVAGLVLVTGSQPRHLPAPFGPAANGVVLFSSGGDIHIVDPVAGQIQALVTGSETDIGPVWSQDGTQFAFRRLVPGGYSLFVAREDGRGLVQVTTDAAQSIDSVSFSPDGGEVMFTSGTPSKISIAKTDGSGTRILDLDVDASEPSFRPSDGNQIVFGAAGGTMTAGGIYVVNADGSALRNLVPPAQSAASFHPRWSPDGSLLVYSLVDFTVKNWTVQTHVMAADGSGDLTLPVPAGAVWSDAAAWSNDGTRLALLRGYSMFDDSDVVGVVIPVDGSGTGVETDHFAGSPTFAWAPDDTSILMLPDASTFRKPLILDPRTGSTRPTTWVPDLTASWQRRAS